MLTRKFGRKKAHRSHMLRNLLASLVLHEKVETTEAKAKEIKKLIDTSITTAKKQTVAARRELEGLLFDSSAAEKLMTDLAPRYAGRPSGYSRSFRTGVRKGDGEARMLVTLIPAEKKVEIASAKTEKIEGQADQTSEVTDVK